MVIENCCLFTKICFDVVTILKNSRFVGVNVAVMVYNPGSRMVLVVVLLEYVIVPAIFVLLNWLTVVDSAEPVRFVPYEMVEEGRWVNKMVGVNLTLVM